MGVLILREGIDFAGRVIVGNLDFSGTDDRPVRAQCETGLFSVFSVTDRARAIDATPRRFAANSQ
jgi:hypothetical protein